MQNITQKEFFNTLAEKKNVQVGLNHFSVEENERLIDKFNPVIPEQDFRTCEENKTTYLLFSNGSYLYKNEKCEKKCFKHTNSSNIDFLIITETRKGDDRPLTMVYVVK